MYRLIVPALAGAILLPSAALKTDYGKKRSLRIETESTVSLDTVDFSMERDGEPMERRGGMGGGGSEVAHKVVQIANYLEAEDGAPQKVTLQFDTLGMDTSTMRGEEMMEDSRESPMEGVTLELSLDDEGETVAKVIDGDEPDESSMLEGHAMTLALDALLPEGDVEVGGSWDLDAETVSAAFGFAMTNKLFPRPERQARGDGEGRGGGRRGGGRFGGGGGAGPILAAAEWEGKATLAEEEYDHEGMACVLIELEIEASGDTPQRERGEGGGGGGDRGGRGGGESTVESTYEITLEGRLLFSVEEGRPVLLEITGDIATDMNSERSWGESTMVMSQSREGKVAYTVTLTEETE